MSAVLASASYYIGGFRLCRTSSAKRVMFPGGSMFHLEIGTITSIQYMYSILPGNSPYPIDIIKAEICHHCFVTFQKDPPNARPTACLLSHLSRFSV